MFRTAFLDLLLNVALAFVCLFVVAVIHMRPPTKPAESIEQKAELVLEMTWPDGSLDDIDLWLLTPSGDKIGFNRQDTGLATLDRDDRGAYGDTFHDGTQRRLIRINREIMAIRAVMPGRYVVNVHYYNDWTPEHAGFPEEHAGPIPVRVKLTDMNPRIREVGSNEVTLFAVGQQATVFAFEVDAQGNVTALHKDADLPFVEVTKQQGGTS